MQKLRNFLDKSLEMCCVGIFVFMTIVGLYQIITRYVFSSPSTVSEEILIYSFTWLAFLASALVFGKREHMRMSFLADKVQGVKAIYLSLLSEFVVGAFNIIVLIFGGIAITQLTMIQITASLGIVMGYIYMILPISGFIILIYNVLNIKDSLNELKNFKKEEN